jgi:histidine phosphotransferase ChpT
MSSFMKNPFFSSGRRAPPAPPAAPAMAAPSTPPAAPPIAKAGASAEPAVVERPPAPSPVTANELASHLAARLCHDFISPAGAIVSGLDLLDDPTAQDMREEAMGMIAASANKLVALIKFNRIAFGGGQGAEVFDTRELRDLAQGVFSDMRAKLDWAVTAPGLDKPAARALLSLAQVGAGVLPAGGQVRVEGQTGEGGTVLTVSAAGRARLRAEIAEGLRGERLSEGRTGHWVQAYYLRRLIDEAGGTLRILTEEAQITFVARFPPSN